VIVFCQDGIEWNLIQLSVSNKGSELMTILGILITETYCK